MRPIAALLAAFPLFAAAQTPPPAAPPQTWTTEPPPAAAPAAAQPEAAPPAAQPTQAAPAPAQPTYPPPPQYAPPPQYPPPPQYAPPPQPPPQYAPPQYAPPPARPYARPPKTRDHWYIGFGFGGGDGKVKNDTGTSDFTDLHYGGMTNVFMNFHAGGTLNPKLLVGGDLSFMGSVADKDGISTSLGIGNFDAVVTFFPVQRGFFLRGGLGGSSLSYTVETPLSGKREGSASGFNVLGGVGYAWWIAGQFNLTANLDFSRQWYGKSTDLNVDDSQFWSFWIGADWY